MNEDHITRTVEHYERGGVGVTSYPGPYGRRRDFSSGTKPLRFYCTWVEDRKSLRVIIPSVRPFFYSHTFFVFPTILSIRLPGPHRVSSFVNWEWTVPRLVSPPQRPKSELQFQVAHPFSPLYEVPSRCTSSSPLFLVPLKVLPRPFKSSFFLVPVRAVSNFHLTLTPTTPGLPSRAISSGSTNHPGYPTMWLSFGLG